MPIAGVAGFVEERWSRAAKWSRRIAVLAFAIAAVGLGSHNLALIDTGAFFWVLAVVLTFAVFALLLAAAGFQRVWYSGDRGGGDLTLGVVLALLLLAPFAVAGWMAFKHPALADISTDLDDPPRLDAAAAFRAPDMNALSQPSQANREEQAKAYPELTGRRYGVAAEQVASAVETLIQQRGWQILSPMRAGSEIEVTVEALAKLPVLALPYDVAVRITDEGNASYVDMRSASRFGTRDMGINAARITAFLTDLDTQAAALAATPAPAE